MSLARHVATVGSASFVSRLLGFARDMALAALFGAGARADAFFVAFQFANLIRRLLAEGGLNASIVPLYLRARDEDGARGGAAFAGRLIGTSIVALGALALVFAAVMPAIMLLFAPGFSGGDARLSLATTLARLMLPYLVVAGPVAVLIGVLNANHRFALAAYVTTAFNVVMLGALALVFALHGGDSAWSGEVVAIAVGGAGLAQLALVALAMRRARLRVTPLSLSFGPAMRRFLALAAPGLVASGIPQITVIAGVMVASASPSAVSWIYYANRLIELPLGIVGIAIGTVLVPAFTHAARSGDKRALVDVESRGLELSLGLALPAAVALAVLAKPIVEVLFQRGAFGADDTAATAAALAAFAAGLPGHVLVKTFSPVFYAREDTGTPMRAALVAFVLAVAGSLALMPALGHVGIAVAIAASGWAGAVLLGAVIARRFGFGLDAGVRRRLPRIVLAALVMGLVLEGARRLFGPGFDGGGLARALTLAALVVVGLVVYGLLLALMRVVTPRDLLCAASGPP